MKNPFLKWFESGSNWQRTDLDDSSPMLGLAKSMSEEAWNAALAESIKECDHIGGLNPASRSVTDACSDAIESLKSTPLSDSTANPK